MNAVYKILMFTTLYAMCWVVVAQDLEYDDVYFSKEDRKALRKIKRAQLSNEPVVSDLSKGTTNIQPPAQFDVDELAYRSNHVYNYYPPYLSRNRVDYTYLNNSYRFFNYNNFYDPYSFNNGSYYHQQYYYRDPYLWNNYYFGPNYGYCPYRNSAVRISPVTNSNRSIYYGPRKRTSSNYSNNVFYSKNASSGLGSTSGARGSSNAKSKKYSGVSSTSNRSNNSNAKKVYYSPSRTKTLNRSAQNSYDSRAKSVQSRSSYSNQSNRAASQPNHRRGRSSSSSKTKTRK